MNNPLHNNTLTNKKAYEVFFKENYSALCRFAYTFLNDADDAEEVVQSTFVKLWKDKEKVNITSSLKSYLYSSVRNSCLNQKKHIEIRESYKQDNKRLLDEGNNLEAEIEASELKAKINTAIDKLPLQRKRVFVLSRFEGLQYKEIAQKLNISPKTVENHMGLTIKFLKEELKDYLHLPLVIFLMEELGDKLL